MKKALGALVVAAGLVMVAGCARQDRWTWDGSRPKPLDDRTSAEMAISPERAGRPRERYTAEEAIKKVQLVQENGVCKIRSGDSAWPITAKVQVQPGVRNTPADSAHAIEVVVLPNSETTIGRTSIEGTPNEWNYRLLSAEFNRYR